MEREAHDLGSYNFEVVAGLDGGKKSISFIPAVQKANGAYVTLMSDNWLSLGVGNSDAFNKKSSFIPVKNLDASGKYDGTFTMKSSSEDPYFADKNMVLWWGMWFSNNDYYKNTQRDGNRYNMKAKVVNCK